MEEAELEKISKISKKLIKREFQDGEYDDLNAALNYVGELCDADEEYVDIERYPRAMSDHARWKVTLCGASYGPSGEDEYLSRAIWKACFQYRLSDPEYD